MAESRASPLTHFLYQCRPIFEDNVPNRTVDFWFYRSKVWVKRTAVSKVGYEVLKSRHRKDYTNFLILFIVTKIAPLQGSFLFSGICFIISYHFPLAKYSAAPLNS